MGGKSTLFKAENPLTISVFWPHFSTNVEKEEGLWFIVFSFWFFYLKPLIKRLFC